MELKFNSLIQVIDHFKDEQTCKDFFICQRWGNGGPSCPHCGSAKKPYVTNRGYKCSDRDCLRKFTFATGTVYENTKISLRLWIAAIYLITARKKGISSLQLARDLNISRKTAWFLSHRIRAMITMSTEQKMTGQIEVDESYIGGKIGNKHESVRKKMETLGRGIQQHPIVSLVQRNGEVRTIVTPDVGSAAIFTHITNNIKQGEQLITDGFSSYKFVGRLYDHTAVKHNPNRVTFGDKHTNNVECYFSHFKRMVDGTFHSISTKHMQRYCNEMDFRYSTRCSTDGERFIFAIGNTHTRLRYTDLVRNGQKESTQR